MDAAITGTVSHLGNTPGHQVTGYGMPQNADIKRGKGKYRTALILLATVIGLFVMVIAKHWK